MVLAAKVAHPSENTSHLAAFDQLPNPILILEAGSFIVYANPAALEFFGGRILGRMIKDALPTVGAAIPDAQATGATAAADVGGSRFHVMLSQQATSCIVSLFPAESTGGQDQRDELTGLLKRDALSRRLSALTAAASSGAALHFIDLDRFKVINDTLGHAVGDLLLKKVADRLRAACRRDDTIARLGGDEFVILQENVTEDGDAERLAARLVDLVGRTYVINGHTINIGASVGVAPVMPPYGPRDLLRNGDLALYEAKRAGRGRFRIFEPGMDDALRSRRELEIELRRALALKQFELHYQPFIDLDSNEIRGYEALIRWKHPTRGWISPADFIPLAEETGLITKIGQWVLRTACQTAMSWPDDHTIAVNVSPMQFKADDLVSTVLSALAHSGLPAHRLEVEITEGALLDDTPAVLKTLFALKELGVKISMDDFGTGYSSLSYLQKFPFNKIKIDRSFVQGAAQGGDSEAILKAIASLGVSLGMAITAEGVETEEQLQRIRAEKCTHVQGFLTGRPQPADRLPSNQIEKGHPDE